MTSTCFPQTLRVCRLAVKLVRNMRSTLYAESQYIFERGTVGTLTSRLIERWQNAFVWLGVDFDALGFVLGSSRATASFGSREESL